MRIVKAEEFLKMPPGTVFMKYRATTFSELMVKEDTLPGCRDFFYFDLVDGIDCESSEERHDILDRAEEDSSIEVRLNLFTLSRDGMFDMGQLYAVYSEQDVLGLTYRLVAATRLDNLYVQQSGRKLRSGFDKGSSK